MQQVVDLQNSKDFQRLGASLVSFSPDPVASWREDARQMGIRTALLSDPGNRVATLYGVMKWRMGNEPGHTFILVDRRGDIAWIRDYGAPQHGEIMYVDPKDLVPQIASHVPSS